jgi:murein L,D-transpeptidase YcbB/YkuD
MLACVPITGCQDLSGRHASAEQPSWDKTTTAQLRNAIAARAAHGLDRVAFPIASRPGGTEGDAGLTQAALAFAGALSHGVADPRQLYEIYTLPRPRPDLERGLQAALKAEKVDAWLQSLAPQDPAYRKLSQGYLAIRNKPPAPKLPIPPNGSSITPGSADPRIPAIAVQLARYDYLGVAPAGNRYTRPMVAAVRKMQADYGIRPDGVIGADALTILNLSDEERARAIAVDMERLRWLRHDPPATRIDVNLAAARLAYWRDGKLVDVRKVVVGRPDKPTPQLGSPIFQLVANPTWTVPRSIEQDEIAAKGDDYLRANNMRWQDGWIVQGSGPKNSLGLVKFNMKDKQGIYLHDTPAKALFNLPQRQRSHGCVRVSDALGFAKLIAADQGISEIWHKALDSGEESFVPLRSNIPVRLLYQTVLFDQSGDPVVRSDPYQWNDRVAATLGFAATTIYRLRSDQSDIGP